MIIKKILPFACLAILICILNGGTAFAGSLPVRLIISVEPLTDNIEIGTAADGYFFIHEQGEYGSWRFIYRIEHVTEGVGVINIRGSDNYSPELNIVATHVYHSDGADPGTVFIDTQGTRRSYVFKWGGINLTAGQWVELHVDVETNDFPDDYFGYGTCGWHDLNGGAVFKYNTKGPPISESRSPFKLNVPCTPYMDIEISSTEVNWYLSKSGDYYACVLKGRVAAHHPVAITFAYFDDLTSVGNGASIPVFYALNKRPGPADWLEPAELNSTRLLLELDSNDTYRTWNLWQRVVLNTQAACTYKNEGVMMLTLVNTETFFTD